MVEAPSEESSLTEASTTADCSALLSYSSFADCHRVRVGESACRDDDSTDPHFPLTENKIKFLEIHNLFIPLPAT